MSPISLAEDSQKRLAKLAIRSAKEFIAARGIHATTRKGSKELELLIKKIAGQSLATREQATKIGQNVGEKRVELSRQKAKNNLDKGVVRQLAAQKEIFSLAVSSADKISSTLQLMDEKSLSKLETPVIVSKSVKEVQFAEASDEGNAEDSIEEIVEEIVEVSDDEILEDSIKKNAEFSDNEILEEIDEESVEDSIEEIVEEIAEFSDDEILEEIDEESVDEIIENSDEKIVEDFNEDVLDKNLPELQEEYQEEKPVELSDRSEAIAIDSVQSQEEKLVDY